MDKSYQPQSLEREWYQRWEENGYFAPGGDGEPYCILLPPPNVTGSLHMGHGFQQTLMDVLIRRQRMRGRRTLWQCGTDHAGIATQMVVERQLEAEGGSRAAMGREAFVERVWQWKRESGSTITRQMRRLGVSPDWDSERFTMDEGLSAAVREFFVRLYEDGLIYRGQRLVNWDPTLGTAVSDLEVVNEEEDGHLWHIRYPEADGGDGLVVATTRPETLLGDSAVAVHPDDARYSSMIGRMLRLPLCDRQIPVIADAHVDAEFGSGCVKITPAHDFNDYEMGQRHDLPMINILNTDASIADTAPAPYRGLDRFRAREQVLADLRELNLLQKEEPYKVRRPRGDRSGAPLEPWLTDQWFVRMGPMAELAIEAVENGRVRFVPEGWKNTYFAWMREIRDWCVSRQLWWGHRVPAWYDEGGEVYVGRDEDEVRRKHNLGPDVELRPDEDVLDTWFSSALWSFSTLGWPEDTSRLREFHPTQVLVTGFDIIFFWVARMMMSSLYLLKQEPFAEVLVTGLVRDSHGRKMSKSEGNALDPIDLIDGVDLPTLIEKVRAGVMRPKLADAVEKNLRKEFPEGIPAHGADALRLGYCMLAGGSRDIRFDMKRIEGCRNFCNKLWNAARYALMRIEESDDGDWDVYDRWIRSKLQRAIDECDQALENYRFDRAAEIVHHFIWHEYCDWYLELSKPAIKADAPALGATLEAALRLAHPIMPFITEEIWQRLKARGLAAGETIMLQSWPQCDEDNIDVSAEAEVEWLKRIVEAVRNIRGEYDIAPSVKLSLSLRGADPELPALLSRHRAALLILAGLKSVRTLKPEEEVATAASATAGRLEALVEMSELLDVERERRRLAKRMTEQRREMESCDAKLKQSAFIDKAPSEVVDKIRARRQQAEQTLQRLRKRQQLVNAMDANDA